MESNDNKKLLMSEDEFHKDALLSEMFDSYDEYCRYMTVQSIKKLEGTV